MNVYEGRCYSLNLNARLSPELCDALEWARGTLSRSEYVRRLIMEDVRRKSLVAMRRQTAEQENRHAQ